jgi:hypothetical protein
MPEVTKPRIAVAALVAAAIAIAAPSAGARPSDSALPARATPATPPPADATPTVAARSSGFHWEDAGVGAAGMLSVLGLGTGALVLGRRGRRGQATTG